MGLAAARHIRPQSLAAVHENVQEVLGWRPRRAVSTAHLSRFALCQVAPVLGGADQAISWSAARRGKSEGWARGYCLSRLSATAEEVRRPSGRMSPSDGWRCALTTRLHYRKRIHIICK